MDLADKVCVITGSGGGLGKEFALRLLEMGCKVVISDVNEELGRNTASEFKEKYGPSRATFIGCDVTKADQIKALFDEAEAFFGNQPIDMLVNNAGVMGEREGWKACMDINLYGVLHGCTQMLDRVQQGRDVTGNKDYVIVNVSSILGLFTGVEPKGWAYNTSKCGVVTATRCMVAAHPRVRVMCLCPSVTKTPILEACTAQEVEKMRKDVGGIMDATQVGDAFVRLLTDGQSGDVVGVWKDTPPYYIPNTSMPIFIFWTVCAMAYRLWPASLTPTVISTKHMALSFLVIVLLHVLSIVATYMLLF